MQYKRAFLTLLAVILLGLAGGAGLNLLVDPFHLLHRPLWGPPRFSGNQRYQNAGLINSYLAADLGFDTLVIGTSLESAFGAARIKDKLGTGRVLVLTMDGSLPMERSALLERAFQTGKVRRVLWGVFHNYTDMESDRTSLEYAFPYGLYREPLSLPGLDALWHYLLNGWVFNKSVALVAGTSKWSTDMTGLYNWNAQKIRDRVFESFNSPESLAQHTMDLSRGKAMIAWARQNLAQAGEVPFPALDKHLVQVVQRHPEVRFDIVFTPLSALAFHLFTPAELMRQIGMQQHLVRVLGREPNVRIFAFQDDVEVTGNLANFWDTMHSSYLVSDRVVDAIAEDRHRLTPENVDAYLARFLDWLYHYEVYSDRERSLWPTADTAQDLR